MPKRARDKAARKPRDKAAKIERGNFRQGEIAPGIAEKAPKAWPQSGML
jgi:hypothetical protein